MVKKNYRKICKIQSNFYIYVLKTAVKAGIKIVDVIFLEILYREGNPTNFCYVKHIITNRDLRLTLFHLWNSIILSYVDLNHVFILYKINKRSVMILM